MAAQSRPPEVAPNPVINYLDEVVAKRISKTDWIRMVLTDENYGECNQISLVHMVGEVAKEIHSVKMVKGVPREPSDLAKLFDDRAAFYCQDLPGAQTFNLVAFYGEGGSARSQNLPFQKTGAGSQVGLLTEGPDERGRTQMTMRHTEMLGSQYFRGHQIVMETMASMVRELRMDNRDMRRDIQESWGVVRQIMLDTAEIQHRHKMEELQFQRATEDRKMIMRFLPAVINEATGKQIIPQSTVDSHMMDMVVDNLTPEQLKMAAESGMLPQEVTGFLAKRMLQREKLREKEAAADTKAKEVTEKALGNEKVDIEEEV